MYEEGRYWVDAPKGDEYGFPRLYEPHKDGDLEDWLLAQGYPRYLLFGYRDFVRVWKCED
jgi:hypothetical protein